MKLASVFGHVQNARRLEDWHGWPLPKCHIGLEWEFERGAYIRDYIARKRDNKYLAIHDDGSLRDQGVEFVTSGDGLFGYDLLDAIDYLSNAIHALPEERRPVCNYRTGFHVHIDVRDMEEKELHNVLLLYCLFEKPIFNFVGRDRWKSNFAVPWFRSDSQFHLLKQVELAGEFGPQAMNAYSARLKALQRYSALNCQAIAKLGTLEFRHMENDIGELKSKQIEFIKIVMQLKKMAQEMFAAGLHGQALFEHCKQRTPTEMCARFGINLPMEDWDYPETLMLAVQLVTFKKTTVFDDFNDVMFMRFSGAHPKFR